MLNLKRKIMFKLLFWTAIVGTGIYLYRSSVVSKQVIDKITQSVVNKVSDYIPEYV